MSTMNLWTKMVVLMHQPILGRDGNIKVHVNKSTGEKWCYCKRCNSLGAIKDDRIYGAATRKQCVFPQHINSLSREDELIPGS